MKDGYVIKNLKNTHILPQDLEMINKLTRRNFSEDEIYTFNVVLCDNEIDRENEKFTNEALDKLSELFVGKTGIIDHTPSSKNQTARIYHCYTEEIPEKLNTVGEPYKRLIAKCYMPKSQKNENIILEIDSGIKKEVSVGCAVKNKICSICGTDINKEPCAHTKGKKYRKNGKYTLCYIALDNPTDAYEWSFVAVPAQKAAGVIKSFKFYEKGGEKNMDEILKALGSGKTLTLSENETKEVFSLIKNLKEKAEAGEYFKEELKKEVIKLSGIVQPEISSSLIKSIADKISIKELTQFRDCFKERASKVMPLSPQFSSEESKKSSCSNTQFKL